MRLQHVSVIFVIIFLPIILVTSYFISLQVETIKLESEYNNKLLKATYDAMTAFELNTANENLSSVSDSLRSIIDASTNIFFNTLCTNLGVSNASKSFVQPYIPSILYTLYDGYYIYSPTNIPEICTDDYGRTIRTSDYGVKFITTITENGRKIGIYEFDKSKIEYSASNPTEPVGAKSGYVVKYSDLGDAKQEYGQVLYKNKPDPDGKVTYSTELHREAPSTYYKRSYILKSYIPYSARYSGTEGAGSDGKVPYDITINYTLDNFLTVEGTIGEIYYTKSGYLTEKGLVKRITVKKIGATDADVDFNPSEEWIAESEDDLIDMINAPETFLVSIELNDGIIITNQDGKVDVKKGEGSETLYWDDAKSALEYYVKSSIFSNWFYENLKDVPAVSLQNTQYSIADVKDELKSSVVEDFRDKDDDKKGILKTEFKSSILHEFSEDKSMPFADEKNDPEDDESPFYEHKRNVIKNSITYNLVLSMLVYSEDSKTLEYNMPIFTESEWNTILNNISIAAFMQGMRCGLKFFNNYAIVTSTNNEITVTDNEIYYTPRVIEGEILASIEDNDIIETAHRIDCEELVLSNKDSTKGDVNFQGNEWLGCISFKSKEIKYDKILNKDGSYTYDHKVYTDYDCIVDSNYTVHTKDGQTLDGNKDVIDYLKGNVSSDITNMEDNFNAKLKAYRIAIAKERNNLYKTTAFPENYGWQVIMNSPGTIDKKSGFYKGEESPITIDLGALTKKKLSEIWKIEVTIEGASNDTAGIYTDNINAQFNETDGKYSKSQTISTTSKSRRTLEFKQDFTSDDLVSEIKFSSERGTKFYVDAVKVYFK